jgi:predicted dehydrogenase
VTEPDFFYDLPAPDRRDIGIGIVGAGTIVANSHLPAYREAGFRVVALCDRRPEHAETLATRFGVPRTYGSVPEMLADPDVEVVDIAVPPANQFEVAQQAIAGGRHLLCHKPLATTFGEGRLLVEAAEARGVRLGVNQNARWLPGIRATANLLARGTLGDPLGIHFDLGWQNEYESMDPDWRKTANLTLTTDVVHHVDTCRLWVGEPEWVFADAWRRPHGETGVQALLHYSDTLVATIRATGGESIAPAWARYRVEGTAGRAEGELAQYTDYGLAVRDPYVVRLAERPDAVYEPAFPYTTIPHAFAATMGLLLRAVERGEEPEESGGRDNLETLRIVAALGRSIEERRIVRPTEIEQEIAQ